MSSGYPNPDPIPGISLFDIGGSYRGSFLLELLIEPLSDPTTTPRLQSDTHDPSDTQSDTHDKSNSHTIPPKYDFATLISCD